MNDIYKPCLCNSGKKFKFCCFGKVGGNKSKGIPAQLSISYPLYLCLATKGWQSESLAQTMLVRTMSNGRYIFGMYLIDVWFLGVKNCDIKVDISLAEVVAIKEAMEMNQDLIPISYEDLRSLVFGSIRYAYDQGFAPHDDWEYSKHMLEPDRPFNDKFEFGCNGKPCYIQGPYDEEDGVFGHRRIKHL
jgi:hypothetical protein